MKGFICIILGLATAASLVSASIEPLALSNSELSRSEQKAAVELSEYFAELEDILRNKQPDSRDPEGDMKVFKELLDGTSSVKVARKMKKALELLAELDEFKYTCNHKSYLVYAKNHVATIAFETKNRATGSEDTPRIRIMLDHYQKVHSKRCSGDWRHYFLATLSHVDYESKSFEKIKSVLRDIGPCDFIQSGGDFVQSESDSCHLGRKQFLAMRLPELSESPVPEVIYKIVRYIKLLVEETKHWESLKPRVGGKTAEPSFPRPPKKIFDEYLFKPCEKYEKKFGENLNHARLDAMGEEEGTQFMADRQRLYQAIVESRICKKVLEEQSKLYNTLSDVWVANLKRFYS